MLEISDLGRRGIVLSMLQKTKALISFAVTAKLICAFVFAYAKSQFSHNAAHTVHLDLRYLNMPVPSHERNSAMEK